MKTPNPSNTPPRISGQIPWNDPYETRSDSPPLKVKTTQKLPPAEESGPLRCPDCDGSTKLITAEQAAALGQVSRRQIYRWVEDGSLHFTELPDGQVLVCGRTLAAKLE